VTTLAEVSAHHVQGAEVVYSIVVVTVTVVCCSGWPGQLETVGAHEMYVDVVVEDEVTVTQISDLDLDLCVWEVVGYVADAGVELLSLELEDSEQGVELRYVADAGVEELLDSVQGVELGLGEE
jgi:hypothetical protein